MRRTQGRNTYYTVCCLRDGTVTAAYPTRKPAKRIMKRDHISLDADNVCKEYVSSGRELLDLEDERRLRFFDIIATSLNSRRALRQIVLPRQAAIEAQLTTIHTELALMKKSSQSDSDD